MSESYRLEPSADDSPQSAQDRVFLGGSPLLPPELEIPCCFLCGSPMAFFFQVQFPPQHVWSGSTLAVFACISCADEDWLIPEMLTGALSGASIPEGFLEDYQRNFRFLVFDGHSAVLREDYSQKVAFRRLELAPKGAIEDGSSKVGGEPTWLLEDEAPSNYAGRVPMGFLLQLEPGLAFETVPGAPVQMTLGLDGRATLADRSSYELFLGNALYLFGTDDASLRLVYAVTQV